MFLYPLILPVYGSSSQALVPIARIVNVPFDAHRFLIGRGGETVSERVCALERDLKIDRE